MRNIRTIKKLANEAIDENGNVDQRVSDFVLKKLTKKELKQFLRTFKKKSIEGSVVVKYDGTLSKESKKDIESRFRNKRISYEKNESLGGGIEIIDNDMIINYSIAGLINNSLEQLNV